MFEPFGGLSGDEFEQHAATRTNRDAVSTFDILMLTFGYLASANDFPHATLFRNRVAHAHVIDDQMQAREEKFNQPA